MMTFERLLLHLLRPQVCHALDPLQFAYQEVSLSRRCDPLVASPVLLSPGQEMWCVKITVCRQEEACRGLVEDFVRRCRSNHPFHQLNTSKMVVDVFFIDLHMEHINLHKKFITKHEYIYCGLGYRCIRY